MELHKIIKLISPEIIFEELSHSNFHKCYQEKSLITLETNAIKKYLQNHSIEHIPVDTFNLPKSYYDEVDYLYDRIINNNTIIECYRLRNLLNNQSLLESQYGFSFLNSNRNDELFAEFNILKEKILNILNDENLFRIHRLEKEIIAKREYQIIKNIYNFSIANSYNTALMFIGSGHRKSISELIKEVEIQERIKLNWQSYNN